jgi:hypothetical protein
LLPPLPHRAFEADIHGPHGAAQTVCFCLDCAKAFARLVGGAQKRTRAPHAVFPTRSVGFSQQGVCDLIFLGVIFHPGDRMRHLRLKSILNWRLKTP